MVNIHVAVQSTLPFGLLLPHYDLSLPLSLTLFLCTSPSLCLFLSFIPSFSLSSRWMDGLQLSKVQQLVPQEITDLG